MSLNELKSIFSILENMDSLEDIDGDNLLFFEEDDELDGGVEEEVEEEVEEGVNDEEENGEFKKVKTKKEKFQERKEKREKQIRERERREEERREEIRVERLKARLSRLGTTPKTCQICFELNESRFYIDPCSRGALNSTSSSQSTHSFFCDKCVSYMVFEKIKDAFALPVIQCPEPSCKHAFNTATITYFLKLYISKQRKERIAKTMSGTEGVGRGRGGRGGGGRGRGGISRGVSRESTQNEGDEYKVLKKYHGFCRNLLNCKISEFFRKPIGILSEEEKLTREYILNNTRYCPRCHVLIEKGEGCNHINCSCGFNFCYGCGWSLNSCKCHESNSQRLIQPMMQTQVTCHYCNEDTHLKKNCPYIKRKVSGKSKRTQTPITSSSFDISSAKDFPKL